MGRDAPGRACPHSAPCGGYHSRPQPRIGAPRNAGYRQALAGNAGGRLAVRGGCVGVFCGAGPDGDGGDHPRRPRLRLHDPRAFGGLCGHWRVELPQPDCLLEIRPRLGVGQCHGVQALRSHPFGRVETGRDFRRGWASGGSVQRGAGAWRSGRRLGDRCPSGQGLADRIGADGAKGLCRRRCRGAPCDDGIGRQVALGGL